MSNIVKEIEDLLYRIDEGDIDPDEFDPSSIYTLLDRVLSEIKRLQKINSDQSWSSNPDRMGGQFTEEEINQANNEGW